MKNLKRSFALSLFALLFFPALIFSQNFADFQKSVLVDIPGDNYDFDQLSSGMPYPFYDFYITWVNKTDSLYTIYLKKVTPETIDSDIIISSDNIVKSNPQITYNSSGPGITIVWANYSESYYSIVRRDYSDSSLSNEVVLIDSLNDDPQITMNYNHLAWIMDDNLYLKELYPEPSSTVLIDSSCNSPSLITDVTWAGALALIYEKSFGSDHHIYLANQNYPGTTWAYSELDDSDNRNPEFGAGDGISFESIENGISKIKFFPYYTTEPTFLETLNTGSNFSNPDGFSYPQVTDQEDTPFFVVFDTDSIENNQEVMLQAYYYGDQFINISDMEGDDYKPRADLLLYNNSAYVVIIWEHQDGVHSTIWMAKTLYHPAGGVKDDGIELSSFELLQNYPNPFNPSTTIEYSLTRGAVVKVNVYDILGNLMAVPADGFQYAGIHKVVFDGKNLSSGVYFYTIEVNGLQKTKAMMLLK